MKKIGDKKKISQVGSTKESSNVEKTGEVGSVHGIGSVKAASGVGSVQGTGAITGRKGALSGITNEQRERIHFLITDEAERMAKDGTIPKNKKDIVKNAVLMAIDSAIVLKEDEEQLTETLSKKE